KRPDVLKSVGKSHLELFDAFERELAELRELILRTLTARYSAEELAFEFPDSDARNLLLQVAGPFGPLARRIVRAKASVPQDFVGGWSIRGREIDLDHWRAIPSFSIVEATLLSIGRDPRHTNFDALFATYGRSDQAD